MARSPCISRMGSPCCWVTMQTQMRLRDSGNLFTSYPRRDDRTSDNPSLPFTPPPQLPQSLIRQDSATVMPPRSFGLDHRQPPGIDTLGSVSLRGKVW